MCPYCLQLGLVYVSLKRHERATQVVSLLRDAPQCSILFNKFIPAYHHHFGHQCRLADYGMTKLAELLAAVSDVAQVHECLVW